MQTFSGGFALVGRFSLVGSRFVERIEAVNLFRAIARGCFVEVDNLLLKFLCLLSGFLGCFLRLVDSMSEAISYRVTLPP